MNYFININHYISEVLNNFVLKNNLENYIVFFADGPIFFLPIFLVGAWLYWNYKVKNNSKKKDLLNIFYGIVFAISINLVIQHFFFFSRPETLIKPILSHIPDASFPSDHASVSIAFLTGLFLTGYKKTAYVFLIFAILMNFSRIAGGIHWFFDVIVGAIIGIISEIIIFKNKKYFEKLNNFIIKTMNYIKL